MTSGVIITGSREEGMLFIESVTYPDGRTSRVHFSRYFGRRWWGGTGCEAYSVYLSDLDDQEVYLYHRSGLWVADDEKPDWAP
ncbi:hypothetical protein LJC56_06120 [Christensenellaceae bacterium OttesenSCG-928-K19]|nr:hypothetical protein [Christensenellaceae bacterium OttesenSCG-928-K19]